jgi:hypothetical protein
MMGIWSGTIIDPDGMILTCAHELVDPNNGKACISSNVCTTCACIIWLVFMLIENTPCLRTCLVNVRTLWANNLG